MQSLDEYDKNLLRLLQINNQLTAKELAEKVSLSPSAVQRRLTRLREDKVIEADVSIVSPGIAGLDITCVVDVILHQGDSITMEKFKSTLINCPEVMQCYYVTGTYDFVMIVTTRNMQHYEQFSKRWLMDNPKVKHFYTHVVREKVKVSMSVTI